MTKVFRSDVKSLMFCHLSRFCFKVIFEVLEMVVEENASREVVAVGEVQTVTAPIPVAASDVLRPATQTSAIGLILPPHDVRGIADKTAQFVARNGILFEKRVMENEKGNNKFNFLNEDSPYHAYYRSKVQEFTEGVKSAASFKPSEKKPSAAKQGPAIPRVLHKPEPDKYTVSVPEGLTALDLDTIKLTAQFVARNGKSFLTGLASREHSNPHFNFLKPTHSMFSFFTSLCDAYSKVLMPPKDIMLRLTKEKSEKQVVLERCLRRLEWEQAKEREEKEAADAAERERIAMQLIDWHDFVIVETIDFHQDEDADLPMPMSMKDVIALNRARLFEYEQGVETEKMDIDRPSTSARVDMIMDKEEQSLVSETVGATSTPVMNEPSESRPVSGTEVVEAVTDVPIKVIKNYKRSDRKFHQDVNPSGMVVSPITGELVKISEMEEHMRVSLIDPKWKEQREAMISKIRETTKADDNEIGKNLLNLAKTRPDIFGSTQEEVSQAVKVSIKEKMMSGTHRPVVWDGVSQSGQVLESQLRSIQESKLLDESSMPPPTTTLRPPIPPPTGYPPPSIVQPPRPMMPNASHHIASGPVLAGQPPVPDEPEPKRQRVEFVLQPEEEFIATYGGSASKVRVQCPLIEGNEKLIGQILEVEVSSLLTTIGHVKASVADVISLPANKQKLSRDGVGFLKDEFSLAHYNVSEDVCLVLGIKERGGRKR